MRQPIVSPADQAMQRLRSCPRRAGRGGWEQGVPAALRLKQLAADSSEQPWLVRAMVASTPRRVVGSIGFRDSPDDRGRVEIGYEVVAGERRTGYAREAIQALLDWAWATGRARTCVASVGPHNGPSLALIESLRFRRVGEQIDEIDGRVGLARQKVIVHADGDFLVRSCGAP